MTLWFQYKLHSCVGEACWVREKQLSYDENNYITDTWDPPATEGLYDVRSVLCSQSHWVLLQ